MSVIIPAYNSETSLGRAIDSALAQEHPPLEVFVINDGSTDRTAEVARAYGDRVIFLEQPNLGQGAARNEGLRRATGHFIAFLDADDLWRPGFLKHCVEFLREHDEAIAVSTGIIVRLCGKPERRWPPPVVDDAPSPFTAGVLENFYEFWARYDHVRTGSNVIRREVIDRAGLQQPDLRISQDLEYWGYLATWGKWGFIPEQLWVGDSTPVAASQGWMKKYHTRRARSVHRLNNGRGASCRDSLRSNGLDSGRCAAGWQPTSRSTRIKVGGLRRSLGYRREIRPRHAAELVLASDAGGNQVRQTGPTDRSVADSIARERYKSMRLAMTSVQNALDE